MSKCIDCGNDMVNNGIGTPQICEVMFDTADHLPTSGGPYYCKKGRPMLTRLQRLEHALTKLKANKVSVIQDKYRIAGSTDEFDEELYEADWQQRQYDIDCLVLGIKQEQEKAMIVRSIELLGE